MAKVSAKSAIIAVDDSGGSPRIISSDCISFEIQQDAAGIDVTGFGDGSKNFIPGLPVIGITLEVVYNTAATTGATTVLRGIIGNATSKTVTITPEGTGAVLSGEFMLDSFTVKGSPDGALMIGTAHFSVMGAVSPAWA